MAGQGPRSFVVAFVCLSFLFADVGRAEDDVPAAEAPAPAAAPATAPSLERAWEALERGEITLALEESHAVVLGEGANAYGWTLRAYILSKAGQKEDAAQAYAVAARLDVENALIQNNLGVVLLGLDKVPEATAALRRALELRPGYSDAQNNLGAALERAGRRREAAVAYRQATEADPRHAVAFNNQGALALREGKFDEARTSFRRANDVDPELGAPNLNLLLLGGRDIEVGVLFDQLQRTAASPGASPAVRARALAALGGRHAARHEYEKAQGLLLQAVRLQPRDPALLNNLAVVEDQLGLDRDAMLHLEAALELRPRSKVVRNNMGIVHVHRGQYDLARDLFRVILEEDPAFHRAHYNLGVVLAARGELQGAFNAFQRAAVLAPDDASVRYNLGLLRRRLGGSQDQERSDYEAAIRLDPELSEAHLSLGCLLADPKTRRDLRDEARARQHFHRFLAVALPTDTEGREQAKAWLSWLDENAK